MTRLLRAFLIAGLATSTATGDQARDIIARSGVTGGLVVHVGAGDGMTVFQVDEAFIVHVIDTDREKVERGRQRACLRAAPFVRVLSRMQTVGFLCHGGHATGEQPGAGRSPRKRNGLRHNPQSAIRNAKFPGLADASAQCAT